METGGFGVVAGGAVVGIPGILVGIPGILVGMPGILVGMPGMLLGIGIFVGIWGILGMQPESRITSNNTIKSNFQPRILTPWQVIMAFFTLMKLTIIK